LCVDWCFSNDDLDDVDSGDQLVVRDERDQIIAVTRLSASIPFSLGTPIAESPNLLEKTSHCRYTFEAQVPDRPFYSVAVAWRDRGSHVFSKDELDRQSWTIRLVYPGEGKPWFSYSLTLTPVPTATARPRAATRWD